MMKQVIFPWWKLFYDNCGNSSIIHRRRAQIKYLKIPLAYKSIVQITGAAKKKVLRKVRKSCWTRWLSLDRSVESVYLVFLPLMQTLQHFSDLDAVAAGFLSR